LAQFAAYYSQTLPPGPCGHIVFACPHRRQRLCGDFARAFAM